MGTKLPGQLESGFDEKNGWAWNAMDTREGTIKRYVFGWIGVSSARSGALDVFARFGKWALV